jgi:outer membrane protein assembly factor BamB
MTSTLRPAPWHTRWWAVALAAIVFPPVGLVLLWIRPWRGWRSALLRPLATIGVALAGLAHLFLFYGLRAEMDGSGMRPILSFGSRSADADALERHRAAERHPSPMGVAAEPAAGTAAPVAAPAVPPGPAAAAVVSASSDAAVPAAAPRAAAAYWTDFRGPNRDGVYRELPILASWPEAGPPLLWRQPIGGGYASFVVAEGRAFTIEQRRSNEVVAAYDMQSGRELWTSVWPGHFSEPLGGDGPRATPTWHAGRLYALGALGEFRCLDASSGRTVWRTNILDDNGARNVQWAMAASPLVVDGKVVVLPGGREASVVAYDAATGAPVWKSQSDRQAYTSPMVVALAGLRHLLIVSAERMMGLSVEDGALLWDYPWTTQYDVNAAQPVAIDDAHVFVSAGYDHGAALVEVTREGGAFRAREVWKNKSMKNRFSSSVLYQGALYGFDEGIFACVDARTGERRWKGGRYGYGQVLLSGDRLVVTTEDGEIALLRATPDRFDEVARVAAIEGKTWNVPALAGGVLLVRNEREMAAFRIAR